MGYTPQTDTSTLVVSLGYAFQANWTGPTSTINPVGFAVSSADIGRVVMLLSGDPNVNPGFTVTWTTIATVPSSSQFTTVATIAGSSIAVVNVVLYRPLPTGSAAINSVESGSIEVDLSITSFATAQFTIISLDGSLIPKAFTPVLITDTEVGIEYFGGEIQQNMVINEPGTTIAYSHIQAEGWEIIAKRLTTGVADASADQNTVYGANNPAVGTFVNLRADQIADYFVSGNGYMRNDGVTGNYDTTGPTLPTFSAIAAKNSDMLDQLCSAASAPGKQFYWWFGPRKVLTIATLGTSSAPFNFSDVDGSDTNAVATHDRPLQQILSNQNYFNRALATITDITQQFVGNGSARTFTLSTAVPATALGLVQISRNGQNQTVGQLGIDKGKQWYYNTGSQTITEDASGTTLSTTDVLTVSFPFWNEIFIDALPEQSSMAAIQSGSGTWEQKIDLQAVSTVVDANSFVQSMLNEAKTPSQEIQIFTYRPGLQIGQTILISLSMIGVIGTGSPVLGARYLIDSITITSDQNRKLFKFTASLDAPIIGNWRNQLKRGIGVSSGTHAHPLGLPGSSSPQFIAAGGVPSKSGGGQTVVCEVPAGTIDGTNTIFTVSQSMNSSPAPILMVNGNVQDPLNATVDFTFAGKTITYTVAPEVGAKHVIWYWTGDGSGVQARHFAGGLGGASDNVDYGTHAAFPTTGDASAGAWVQFSSSSVTQTNIIRYAQFTIGSAVTTVYWTIDLVGSSGAWNLQYGHDTATGVTVTLTFTANIPNGAWRYVGFSRVAATKKVTMYVGDGTHLVAIATLTYGTGPNTGITNAHMTVGDFFNAPSGDPGYVGIVQQHYVWARAISQSEHASAMSGAPPSTNLVLSSQMGNTPEVDLSPTGASGAVTGTTLVAGHP